MTTADVYRAFLAAGWRVDAQGCLTNATEAEREALQRIRDLANMERRRRERGMRPRRGPNCPVRFAPCGHCRALFPVKRGSFWRLRAGRRVYCAACTPFRPWAQMTRR